MSIEVLRVCGLLKRRIFDERARLENLRLLATSTTAELTDLPRGNSQESRVANLTASIVDSENLIVQLTGIKAACVAELLDYLTARIDKFNIRQVMWLRYGFCASFKQITAELHYTQRQIFNFHSAGLKILQLQCS